MNRLYTLDNGGMGLDLDDLEFVFDAYKEAFTGLLTMFGSDVILSGLALTSSTGTLVNVSAGFVGIAGEIYAVDANTAPIDFALTPFIYVEPTSSNDVNGFEEFEDQTYHNTYEIRRGKIVAYASLQPGATLLVSIPTVQSIMAGFVSGQANVWTGRQAWSQGTGTTLGNNNYFQFVTGSGNYYNVEIGNGGQLVNWFNPGFVDGTWLMIRFTGNAGASLRLGQSAGTRPIITPGGESYVFKVGDIALFVVGDSGKHYLVNPTYTAWNNVGGTGQPAFENNWVQSGGGGGQPVPTVAFRKDKHGQVSLKGKPSNAAYNSTIGKIFTLPVGYRPEHKHTFICAQGDGSELLFPVTVFPDGSVTAAASSLTGLQYLYLDAIKFYVD
ncbi:hypothetical protein BH09BAC1_BH09BAC1_05090 [soil metagenome]